VDGGEGAEPGAAEIQGRQTASLTASTQAYVRHNNNAHEAMDDIDQDRPTFTLL
jgi:hypothetical protein